MLSWGHDEYLYNVFKKQSSREFPTAAAGQRLAALSFLILHRRTVADPSSTPSFLAVPQEALSMIRYHSFYPWHREGAYRHLMDEKDEAQLKAVRAFNRESEKKKQRNEGMVPFQGR